MDRDFWLIQQLKRGDERAVDAFVGRYYPLIFQYCRLHCDDRAYAEDLTQETFEKFFRSLAQYQHYGKAANYLYVIARNVCRDFYRQKREVPMEGLPQEAVAQGEGRTAAENPAEAVIERMAVRRALEALPEEYREAVILYYFQGLKQAEIARVQEIGLPLAKYRLREAKKRMAALLKEAGFLGEEEAD